MLKATRKAIQLQTSTHSKRLQEVRLQEILDYRHTKAVLPSTLRTDQLKVFPPRRYHW